MRRIRWPLALGRGFANETKPPRELSYLEQHDMYSGIEDRVFLERVAVTSYGPQGFTINNDIELHGHVMLLPQLPMLWRPNSG